jgi:class 3 adenylate cyclase
MPSESFYRAILNQFRLEYLACDIQHRVYDYSPGVVSYINQRAGPLRGRRLEDLLDELADAEGDLVAVQKGEMPFLRVEKTHHTLAGGESVYITVTVAPFATGLLAMLVDVTAEAELQQRVTQQRNELDLLAGRLAAAHAQLDNLLHRFIPSTVADQAIANPQSVHPGGVRQEVSVLFADLRGFTQLAEQTSPEDTLATMNSCFNILGQIVQYQGGTICLYFGDMIMALFNAPLVQPDHAQRAVAAGLEMISSLECCEQHKICFSVGVNSGMAVVGYLGHDERIDYTAVGEAVNIAARLSTYAEVGQVLIGSRTYDAVKDHFQADPLGPIQLKGMQSPVRAFNVRA